MERQRQRQSPITELIRNSVEKVGVVLAPEKRRVSRQILTDMNIAQLQVIVNDLHSHIEHLNESLVRYLLERDELHMSQDSMLVDIEDMTKYLWVSFGGDLVSKLIVFFVSFSEAKDQTNCDTNSTTTTTGSSNNNNVAKKAMVNTNKERPSIKYQLFAPTNTANATTKDASINQKSRHCVNNNNFNNNNNNSVYNVTTSSMTSNNGGGVGGSVLNGPSKLFRIPNLVKK